MSKEGGQKGNEQRAMVEALGSFGLIGRHVASSCQLTFKSEAELSKAITTNTTRYFTRRVMEELGKKIFDHRNGSFEEMLGAVYDDFVVKHLGENTGIQKQDFINAFDKAEDTKKMFRECKSDNIALKGAKLLGQAILVAIPIALTIVGFAVDCFLMFCAMGGAEYNEPILTKLGRVLIQETLCLVSGDDKKTFKRSRIADEVKTATIKLVAAKLKPKYTQKLSEKATVDVQRDTGHAR